MRPSTRLRPGIPLLTRSQGVQLGVDADQALVIPDTGPATRRALRLLADGCTVQEAMNAHGVNGAELSPIVERLEALSLAQPDAEPTTIRIIGEGALALEVAQALLADERFSLQVVAPGAAHRSPTFQHPLLGLLGPRGFADRIRAGAHWYEASGEWALTIIANDRLECDRALTDHLLRRDEPHLFVRPRPFGAVVGPLVVPGRSACTRCLDLVRCRDPEWPRLLAQLCRRQLTAPAQIRAWAVGVAVAGVRAYLMGQVPDLWGATVEIDERTWVPQVRQWPQHPDCGCTAEAD